MLLRKNEHPGPSGFRDEFMNALADETAGEHDRLKDGLDAFAKLHVQADLPEWHCLMATAVDSFNPEEGGLGAKEHGHAALCLACSKNCASSP